MEVEVELFAALRESAGERSSTVKCDEGSSVGDVLEDLGLPLVDEMEERGDLKITKNGREVAYLQGLETPLEDRDKIALFPPIAGGVAGDSGPVEIEVARDGEGALSLVLRGLSRRLIEKYLRSVGGEKRGTAFTGKGWEAEVERLVDVELGGFTLTRHRVTFRGDPEVLERVVPRFRLLSLRFAG